MTFAGYTVPREIELSDSFYLELLVFNQFSCNVLTLITRDSHLNLLILIFEKLKEI